MTWMIGKTLFLKQRGGRSGVTKSKDQNGDPPKCLWSEVVFLGHALRAAPAKARVHKHHFRPPPLGSPEYLYCRTRDGHLIDSE